MHLPGESCQESVKNSKILGSAYFLSPESIGAALTPTGTTPGLARIEGISLARHRIAGVGLKINPPLTKYGYPGPGQVSRTQNPRAVIPAGRLSVRTAEAVAIRATCSKA